MPYGTIKVDVIETTNGVVDIENIVTVDATPSSSGLMSAADKTKLNGIEDNATADQTGAEIKAAYEGEADTNAFTDTEKTKLSNIEDNATADQTGAEIKAAYEGEADTNAFTDDDLSKLDAIEPFATADQTGAEIKSLYEAEADTNAFTDAEKTKLSGISAGATVAPVDSVAGKTGVVALDKADVGLSDVDNTTDLNKPISTSTQTALDAKADLVGGKLDVTQIPDLAVTEYKGDVADEAAMLAVSGEKGDWVTRQDDGKVYIISGDDPTSASDWVAITYPASAVQSVNSATGNVTVDLQSVTDAGSTTTGGATFAGDVEVKSTVNQFCKIEPAGVVKLQDNGTLAAASSDAVRVSNNNGDVIHLKYDGTATFEGGITSNISPTLGDYAFALGDPSNPGHTSGGLYQKDGGASALYLKDAWNSTTTVELLGETGNANFTGNVSAGSPVYQGTAGVQLFSDGSIYAQPAASDSTVLYAIIDPNNNSANKIALKADGSSTFASSVGVGTDLNTGPYFYADGTAGSVTLRNDGSGINSLVINKGGTNNVVIKNDGEASFGNTVTASVGSAFDTSSNDGHGARIDIAANAGSFIAQHKSDASAFTDFIAGYRGSSRQWGVISDGSATFNNITLNTAPTLTNGGQMGYVDATKEFALYSNSSTDAAASFGFYFNEAVSPSIDFQQDGSATFAGDVTAFSDKRLKENIEAIPDALDKVSELKGVTFNRIDMPNRRLTGVIAQDVEAVMPEAVRENDDGIKSVAYGSLVGLLIESIKELKAEVEELKSRIN